MARGRMRLLATQWQRNLNCRMSEYFPGKAAGRRLTQGDLRLIALSFIAEAPRHGYGIIKLVEEKTADWYSPSPGTVYPTLTYLEQTGYVTASAEGSKKPYAITSKGRDYLKANRDLVETVRDRLTALDERVNRRRRAARGKTINRRNLTTLIEAAFDYLRETASRRLEDNAEAEARLVEIIARADIELQRK
jgi:DNA-binding PadR family transcriptional regulator